MTKEEFLERVRKVHGEKYTFIELPNSIDTKTTKVRAVCQIHGEFSVNARQMYRGSNCPLCANDRKGNAYTRDEYISRAMNVHNCEYSYGNLVYNGNKSDVYVTCKKHGDFQINARYHLRGGGCPLCFKEHKTVGKKRIPYSDAVSRLEEMYGGEFTIVTDEDDYVDTYQKIMVRHNKCGIILEKSLHDLFRGRGCKFCSRDRVIKRLADVNKLSFDDVKGRISEMYEGEYSLLTDESGYVNTKKRVIVKHNACGTVWKPIVNSVLQRNTSCPCCRQSSLEAEVSSFLKSNDICFVPQKHFTWLGLQTLDFYLPQRNIAIECQGMQHFKPIELYGGEEGFKRRKMLDERKRKLCDCNGINLIYYSNIGIDYPYDVIESKERLLGRIME